MRLPAPIVMTRLLFVPPFAKQTLNWRSFASPLPVRTNPSELKTA